MKIDKIKNYEQCVFYSLEEKMLYKKTSTGFTAPVNDMLYRDSANYDTTRDVIILDDEEILETIRNLITGIQNNMARRAVSRATNEQLDILRSRKYDDPLENEQL